MFLKYLDPDFTYDPHNNFRRLLSHPTFDPDLRPVCRSIDTVVVSSSGSLARGPYAVATIHSSGDVGIPG